MAEDWIKMRTDLEDDPAVILICERLGLDEFAVIGRLHRLWSWADKNTVDGFIARITPALLDRRLKAEGISAVLVEEGWLQFTADGVQFVNFEIHNGKSAKKRAGATKRKQAQRDREEPCHADVTLLSRSERDENVTMSHPERDESVTREEKRREEKTSPNGEEEEVPVAAESVESAISSHAFIVQQFNIVAPTKCERLTAKRRQLLTTRLRDAYWRANWQLALERMPEQQFLYGENDRGWSADFDWFLKPNSVVSIVERKYAKSGNAGAGPNRQRSLGLNAVQSTPIQTGAAAEELPDYRGVGVGGGGEVRPEVTGGG